MSQLVSRILLAIFLFPLASVFYLILYVLIHQWGNNQWAYLDRDVLAFIISGAATWVLVAIYWSLLWKSGVKWTKARIGRTALAGAVSLIISCIVGLAANWLQRYGDGEFGTFVGTVLTIVLWLIATVFIWRETPAERASRLTGAGDNAITCPTCGYNLTGLNEARCPECGSKFTLDELLATQPSRAIDVD